MKNKLSLLALLSLLVITTFAQNVAEKNSKIIFEDYGGQPTVLNIEDYTDANTNFRTVLWTGKNLQVTLMDIPVGGDVGLELHADIDQFLRIEQGKALVIMGNDKDNLNLSRKHPLITQSWCRPELGIIL